MTTSAEDETTLHRVASDTRPTVVRPVRPLRQRLRLPLMIIGPALVVFGALWWLITGGRYESTDDAYIQAGRTMISTDISARVVAIEVHDNEQVKKGQVLFRLDPRMFQIAVDNAQAQLAATRLQIDALTATYRQKLADEKAMEDTLAYQQKEYARQTRLLASGISSQAQFDQAANALQLARQKVIAEQHDIGNTLAQLNGNIDIPVDQQPSVQRAQAMLDRAKLDLSYTVIRAAEDGTVTKVEQLQVGDYVNASTPVFSLMSNDVWVEANFKETELTHMRAGQSATVEVDAYPDHDFKARVVSFSPGTGLTFSLLPPENATGNWVKVVQRLPVRLALVNDQDAPPLHAGLSVTVTVDTHYQRPWVASAERFIDHLFGRDTAQAAEK
jgi:membrane fusion protein, multidrug efflux system